MAAPYTSQSAVMSNKTVKATVFFKVLFGWKLSNVPSMVLENKPPELCS